jgi:hypothetical protein
MTRQKTAALLAAGIALAGCEPKRADTGGPAECTAIGELGERSLKKWTDVNEAAPAPNATLDAVAAHAGAMGKTAREIGEAFGKAAPKRTDLAESAQGVHMLGDLAGKKLETLGKSFGDLAARLPELGKLEGAANDEADALGRDVAKNVGCEKKSKECAAVTGALDALDHAGSPAGFSQGAVASRARADGLDALAKAVEGLPAAPPLQKAREETVKHARAAAAAFRALAKALEDAAPIETRLGNERESATSAALRFAQELTAASKLCTPTKGAASASAAPSASAVRPGSPPPAASSR